MAALRTEIEACTRCPLHRHRSQVVVGSGDPASSVMFVGEAPGAEEDRTGRPFAGRSGGLLDRLIAEELDRTREDVYVANVIKCRPPDNRNPASEEIEACRGYLDAQVREVAPEVIVPLGNFAARLLLGTTEGITRLRGRAHRTDDYDAVILPTFHPAAVLRGGAAKLADMREDLAAVRVLVDGGTPA